MKLKRLDLVVAMLALTASSAMANGPKKMNDSPRKLASNVQEELPGDCTELVQDTVAYVAGSSGDEAKKAVKITHVRSVSGPINPNPEHQNSYYAARVEGSGMKGTVKVTMTRGGCQLNALDVSDGT